MLNYAELYLFLEVYHVLLPPCLPTYSFLHAFHPHPPMHLRFLMCLVDVIFRTEIIIHSLIPNTVFLLSKYLLTEAILSSDIEYIGFLRQIFL